MVRATAFERQDRLTAAVPGENEGGSTDEASHETEVDEVKRIVRRRNWHVFKGEYGSNIKWGLEPRLGMLVLQQRQPAPQIKWKASSLQGSGRF